MEKQETRKIPSQGWLIALLAITSLSTVLYSIAYLADFAGIEGTGLHVLLFESVAQGALSGLPEVVAGLLGISITVVAIIVELASNRYTPRITELFMRSPVNLAVLGFFVVTALMCIWVSLSGSSPEHIPKVGAVISVVSITICMLILLPYFAFVFSFLNPHNIVAHMASAALSAIKKGGARKAVGRNRAKELAVVGVDQLADVARGAIENKDKVICMHAVDTLGGLMADYLQLKPKFDDEWFVLDSKTRENPDFVSMQMEVLKSIEDGRYWFEMKVLRQYQMLYGETLNSMRDINYLIAINTRKLTDQAMVIGDESIVKLGVKFFNTYLRATINARDVRTAYNVLNQYRLLAHQAIGHGRNDVAVEIAERFKYYGQLGFAMGLAFILETAAYDLCELNELAFEANADCQDEILAVFLDVDKEAEENHAMEASLRGVRKAQVKLATYYLTHDAPDQARKIYNDMRDELPSRLQSIREELASITAKDFWEISDRGVNFDYLEPDQRKALDVFFGWFGQLPEPPETT